MRNILRLFAIFLGLLLELSVVLGHVSLTFPQARNLPLDFLNSFWTKPPCGMPKGNIRTSLVSGQGFNATWHLGYAHKGGYKLELLDQNENKLIDLIPTRDNDFYQGLNTAQWHFVTIPENISCSGCTLLLSRQVPEFSPDFKFISCADVDIVPKYKYVERCSGHGHVISGRCTCYARYWGDKCQYQDECDTDLDCNGHGRCIYLGGGALPRKQCFCPESHYGSRCAFQNPNSMPRQSGLNLSKHVRVKLDDRITMYFKIFLGSSSLSQDEIEFILQINGTSYGGIGWRPSNITPICKSWPFYPNALSTNGHRISKRSSSGSTFTITKAIDQSDAFQPNSQSQTYTNFNENTRSVSQANSYQQPSYETFEIRANSQQPIQAQQRSVSNSQKGNNVEIIEIVDHQQAQRQQQQQHPTQYYSSAQNNNIQIIQSVQSLPQPRPQSKVNTVKVQTQSIPRQEQQRKEQQTPQVVQNQQKQQPQSPAPTQSGFTPSEWAAKDPFTPMDCSDIVIGSARGNFHRFRDSYARGRHTPLADSIWGGHDDLTGAVGWEYNGMTTLAFRRRMDANDGPDHSIRGDMQVIWARGQEPGETVSISHHQLVPGNPTISEFYTRDEVKYHGLGSQRGLLFIDFDAVRKEFVNGAYSQ